MHSLLPVVTLAAILTTMVSPVRAEGNPNCVGSCLQAGGNIFSCATQCRVSSEPQKKSPPPDPFWSGVYIGGSVSTSTTIRGR